MAADIILIKFDFALRATIELCTVLHWYGVCPQPLLIQKLELKL